MRSAATLTVVMLTLLCATTCTVSNGDNGSATAAISAVESGVLTVATDLPAPGFFDGPSADRIDGGFEYDVATALADALGMDHVRVIDVNRTALLAGTSTEPFDIAMAQFVPADDSPVTFSEPYYAPDESALVLSGTPIATLTQARRLRWGYLEHSSGQETVAQLAPAKDPIAFVDRSGAYAALDVGLVDAVMDLTAINLTRVQRSDGRLEVTASFGTASGFAAIIPGPADKVAAIDAALGRLRAGGVLEDLAAKAFGSVPTVPTIPAG